VALWGDDPKDALIQSQREEIAYLRTKVDELQKELLAMTSASAYRLVHRAQEDLPGEPPSPTAFQLRHEPVSKEGLKTAAEIASQFPKLGES
jgi:hypothetical protein